MEPGWIIAAIMWGALGAVVLVCLIIELRKTPQQREAEATMARKELKKHWENEKRKLRRVPQEIRKSLDMEGAARLFLLIPWVLLAVIVGVLLLVVA